jgi:predicted TIM-barrel fold metal-dependent hydrolase
MRTSILLSLCFLFITGLAGAQTLRGVVDIHAHSGPDSLPRSIDSLSLARLARERGFRGLVLKNHYEPTAALAGLARRGAPGLAVFGGIALNLTVGGINAAAVERMTRVEGGWGKIVWMPTFDAENQVRFSKENRLFVSIAKGGKLLPEVLRVLDLIARYDLVLATGHSSPAENMLLIEEARRRKIGRIVVTHALLGPVSMTPEQAKTAAELGAYIEFVGNAVIGTTKSTGFNEYATAMRTIGFDRVILSSDLGQTGNPLHPDGLEQIFAGLRSAGVSSGDIEKIVKQNPARLLGLD